MTVLAEKPASTTEALAVHPATSLGLTPAQYGALLQAFALPDVSALPNPDDMDIDSQINLIGVLEPAIRDAIAMFGALCRPISDIIRQSKANLDKAAPPDAKAIAHTTFNVELVQASERSRDVAMLRAELPKTDLPEDELAQIVFVKTLQVKGACDPDAIRRLTDLGAKAEWDCDLRKADKFAKKYSGPIAEIIEKATASHPKGERGVFVTPKESAMKRVGSAS